MQLIFTYTHELVWYFNLFCWRSNQSEYLKTPSLIGGGATRVMHPSPSPSLTNHHFCMAVHHVKNVIPWI
jgi:hypothetical protein